MVDMVTGFRRSVIFAIAVLTLVLAIATVIWQSRSAPWQNYQRLYFQRTGTPAAIHIRQVIPRLTHQPELCVSCHLGLEEISPSHPVEVFGCVSCHGGNGLTLEADQAHQGMRGGKNPGDLLAAGQSCGKGCHSGLADADQNHLDQVSKSLQATYAGGIAAVRFAYGAQSAAIPLYGTAAITDNRVLTPNGLTALAAFPGDFPQPIDTRFAQNCLESGCHLSATPRAEPYFYRSTGCSACHILYQTDGLYQGNDPTIPRDEPGHAARHQFTTAIPFSQCNHCHNRGNYSLRQMEFLLRDDLPPVTAPLSAQMPPEGRRLIEYYQPIGEFTLCEWELDCIDCHTAYEIMGDGDIHPNQREMQYTQCQTCHGTPTALPAVTTVTDRHQTALRLARLNPNYDLTVGDQVIITERGELLGNVKVINGEYSLTGKATGKVYPFKPVMGSACRQTGDNQTSAYCHQCHTSLR